jgi:hypothetical protein
MNPSSSSSHTSDPAAQVAIRKALEATGAQLGISAHQLTVLSAIKRRRHSQQGVKPGSFYVVLVEDPTGTQLRWSIFDNGDVRLHR